MARRAQPAVAGHLWSAATAAVLIFVIAVGLRLAYLLSIHNAYFFDHLQTEALRYDEWATLIVHGGTAPRPPFEQAPGYPYAVAGVYALAGHSITGVALLQVLLGTLSCLGIAFVGRQCFGARAGWIAGLLAASYGPFIYFTGELLPPVPFVCVVTAALAAALSTPPRWLIAGGLWALALVVRSESVLAFPVVLFDAWWRGGQRALWRTVVPLGVVLLGFIAINSAHSPRLVFLTTSGGLNLWIGNNPHADGVSPFVSGPLEPSAQAIRAKAGDAPEADHLFAQRAFEFWRTAPGAALRLIWKKFVWTWTDRELPNTSDIDWQSGQSWLFALPVFPLRFGILLPLALAGGIVLGRHWQRCLLLTAPLLVGVGTCVIFFTNARFRLIMLPTILLLAAVAIDRTPSMLSGWRNSVSTISLALLAALIGGIAGWGNLYGVRSYRIPEITVNTGILEREAGELDVAVRDLRAGLADNPRDSIGWIHLALALEQQGDHQASLRSYLSALALMPNDPMLRQMTDQFFQRHGIARSALDTYLLASDQTTRERVAAQLAGILRQGSPGTD